MNPEDPITHLDSYYKGLKEAPVPEIELPRRVRWWEAAGGLVAGATAVVIAVSICLASGDSVRVPVGGVMEHQMRLAGIEPGPAEPRKRAQREGQWVI